MIQVHPVRWVQRDQLVQVDQWDLQVQQEQMVRTVRKVQRDQLAQLEQPAHKGQKEKPELLGHLK